MSRGELRLFQDRGLRVALVGGAVVLGALFLQRALVQRSGQQENRTPTLNGRAWCGGRTAAGARVTLRPPPWRTPDQVGRPYDALETGQPGTFQLKLPWPTAPDFSAELLVAAPGCLTSRQAVDHRSPELTITLVDIRDTPPPLDLADPPPAPGFPPEVPQARLEAARASVINLGDYALFDGPAPTCVQCHASVGQEHGRAHGRAPSPLLRALAAQAPDPARRECARCHAPVAAAANGLALAPLPDHAAFSCSACHRFHPDPRHPVGLGLVGTFALPPKDTRRMATGTRADTASPAMAVERAPFLAGSELCLSCHGQHGLDPLPEEYAAWRQHLPGSAARTCVDCHFPATADPFLVDGYARALWGVSRPDAPRRSHGNRPAPAAPVSLEARWQGERTLVVRAENVAAGHGLPGVAPWQGWEVVVQPAGMPALPGVTVARVLQGAAGVCTLPWEAHGVARDSRLQPGVPQEWTWELPARVAVTVVLQEHSPCPRAPAPDGPAREVARVVLPP